MRLIGPASASQVISAYRFDFVFKKMGKRWPTAEDASPELLPIKRLWLLYESRRPTFHVLEYTWELFEIERDELLRDVLSMWGNEPYEWPLAEMISRIKQGDYILSDESQQHLKELRREIRCGSFEMGILVGFRDSALPRPLSLPNDSVCLLDGHHRIVAAALEDTLPDSLCMFIGRRPVPLRMAVINGV